MDLWAVLSLCQAPVTEDNNSGALYPLVSSFLPWPKTSVILTLELDVSGRFACRRPINSDRHLSQRENEPNPHREVEKKSMGMKGYSLEGNAI